MYDYDLLVVGSANADLVIGVERRPGPGETVLGSDLSVHPGGKGANQAVAAARLGARTALLARVGDDAHGRLLLDSQRSAGVDTAGVLSGGAPTGVALITVDPSGDNSIVVSPGANARLTPADIRDASGLLRASRVISAQLEIPLETVGEVVAGLAPGSRLVLNPSPPVPLPAAILAACDPLIVNEHEARVVLGASVGDDPEEWARALLALGPRSVVITLGARGRWWRTTVRRRSSRPYACAPWTRPGPATRSPRRWPGGSAPERAWSRPPPTRRGWGPRR